MKRKFRKRRPFQEQENPNTLFRKMTRDHVDVLENIEFVLVEAWREHSEIDDRIVMNALNASISGVEPVEPMPRLVFRRLGEMRLVRSDVDDPIWIGGLKVVLESVHTHSNAHPGDIDYLKFSERFIP